ncbi:hypothetical protein ACL02R_27270 [Streptomyces sp. MS19]|uniref:hypothetical protein n=1 Tax=Streptomyces sp. MS19 TaxID=3385972 RepID=UPI0039A07334
MTAPVYICGQEVTVLPYEEVPRVHVGKRLRCELAEHHEGPHHQYAAEIDAPYPTAEWARWSDDTRPEFGVLPDCDTHNGASDDDKAYCVLFEGHPPPCSWVFHDPAREVEGFLADLGISWQE